MDRELQNRFDASFDVAVLAGGSSSERDVSLASGQAVAESLREAGDNVAVFDPAGVSLSTINWHQFDACFIALHGGAGEDGRVQQSLEDLSVPYTGSGPAPSRIAMSKAATKVCLERQSVPVPPAFQLRADELLADIAHRLRPLGYPLVIKPDSQGCSLGVGVARGSRELAACIAAAGQFEPQLLAELMIRGREFTVSIIGRQALPVLEIEHDRPLFDFEAKFQSRETAMNMADEADPSVRAAVDVALAAAAAVGTRGLVRVDVIVDRTGQPWVLELNTVPGMTRRSLAPRAAALAGIDMPELCHRLLSECLVPVEVLS